MQMQVFIPRSDKIAVYLQQNQNCYINGKAICNVVRLGGDPNNLIFYQLDVHTQRAYQSKTKKFPKIVWL